MHIIYYWISKNLMSKMKNHAKFFILYIYKIILQIDFRCLSVSDFSLHKTVTQLGTLVLRSPHDGSRPGIISLDRNKGDFLEHMKPCAKKCNYLAFHRVFETFALPKCSAFLPWCWHRFFVILDNHTESHKIFSIKNIFLSCRKSILKKKIWKIFQVLKNFQNPLGILRFSL